MMKYDPDSLIGRLDAEVEDAFAAVSLQRSLRESALRKYALACEERDALRKRLDAEREERDALQKRLDAVIEESNNFPRGSLGDRINRLARGEENA
jgi:ferritin-like metal-binding protein YciE